MSGDHDSATFVQPDSFSFSEANMAAVRDHIAKYPERYQASALLPVLDIAQRQNNGWLPKVAMDYVADLLNVPPIQVYEAATFYTMYNLKPVGRHHVQLCTNISCWLRGCDEVLTTCRDTLGIDFGETTEDGLFTLTEVECLGACVNAPMMQINDDYYEDLDAGSVQAILTVLKGGGTAKPGPQSERRGCEPIGGPTSLTEVRPSARGKGRKGAGAKPKRTGGA